MNRLVLIIIFTVTFAFTVLSCKTGRHHTMSEPLKEIGPEFLFESMKKSEFGFNTLSLKFSADLEVGNEGSSFSGIISLIRDSLMWISIQKFGIEAVRLYITKDSVKMMNRINKTYFINEFSRVNELFKTDFDFDILQSVITGNDFTYYENNVFKAVVDNKLYKLSTLGRQKIKKFVRSEKEYAMVLIQDIWLDPETFKIVKLSLKELKAPENRKLICEYSDFETINNKLFPKKIQFHITDEKRTRGVIIINKISMENPESLPFSIPSTYTKSK